MNKIDNFRTSNAEMVTISRAEYEKLQAQSKRVSELESRVDLLMEALPVMGTGYLGIFIVTGIIIGVVTLLNKFGGK